MRPLLQKVLSVSRPIFTDAQLKDYVKVQKFDAFVVGSDQVWRPRYSPCLGWYFLDFLSEEDKAKRVALSASFGVSEWEYTEEQEKYCAGLIKKFDAVSLRERSGVDLCHTHFGINATQLIDPTLMLKPEDYQPLIDNETRPTESLVGKVFSYVLDRTDETDRLVRDVSAVLDLPVAAISFAPKRFGSFADRKVALTCAPPPIAQWLRGVREASFVVTDSFHGTVFSILHHRPFLVLGNPDRGLARIETLLAMFGLEARYVLPETPVSSDFMLSSIDWKRVDDILETKRAEFRAFLSLYF